MEEAVLTRDHPRYNFFYDVVGLALGHPLEDRCQSNLLFTECVLEIFAEYFPGIDAVQSLAHIRKKLEESGKYNKEMAPRKQQKGQKENCDCEFLLNHYPWGMEYGIIERLDKTGWPYAKFWKYRWNRLRPDDRGWPTVQYLYPKEWLNRKTWADAEREYHAWKFNREMQRVLKKEGE